MQGIEINKDDIPYTFEMEIDEEVFQFEIRYNLRFDFFTLSLSKDNKVIVAGEKLVLGVPLFATSSSVELPNAVIVPLDLNDTENRITYENLSETVFLFVEVLADDTVST
jgi:hypothetical protein